MPSEETGNLRQHLRDLLSARQGVRKRLDEGLGESVLEGAVDFGLAEASAYPGAELFDDVFGQILGQAASEGDEESFSGHRLNSIRNCSRPRTAAAPS